MSRQVAFLHPDLGLGGAERLIVDAAMALVSKGDQVTMFTSHYPVQRSFEETCQGHFKVHVYGDWIPRHIFGCAHILFAMLRAVWLALCVTVLYPKYDVYVTDQISLYNAVLRFLRPSAAVVFYCHFPDQLLSSRGSLLKRIYRIPFDLVEELTTAMAHRILVNSGFTRSVFLATFKRIKNYVPDILYPCVTMEHFASVKPIDPRASTISFLSINRYEDKKNVALALRAFAVLRDTVDPATAAKLRLVIAGGYDTRVAENVNNHAMLVELAKQLRIEAQVQFVQSFTDQQKLDLLSQSRAVLYTPSNEHFGIVPLECMAAGRPVVAVSSGGPLETVVDRNTGFLKPATPADFAAAMKQLALDGSTARMFGDAGRGHVEAKFSRAAFATQLHLTCTRAMSDAVTYSLGPHLVVCAIGSFVVAAAVKLVLYVV